MTTSLITFRSELTEVLMDFVWGQWCQLGAAGSSNNIPEDRIIDPECLLAFSTEIARHDARVFDEIMDWMTKNGQWINVQRLTKIVTKDQIGDPAVIGAIAHWMTRIDRSLKWKGIAQKMTGNAKQPAEFLFHSMKNSETPIQHDESFSEYGLTSHQVKPRGMSQKIDMKIAANAAFKFRALFGIGVRSDVMLYMVTKGFGHARKIADFLGYNHMSVYQLMSDLADSRILTINSVGRKNDYSIKQEDWWSVIMEGNQVPKWPDWRSFYHGVTHIFRETWGIDKERADDYIASSIIHDAIQKAGSDLFKSDVGLYVTEHRSKPNWDKILAFPGKLRKALNSQ